MMAGKIDILGLGVDAQSMAEIVDFIAERIKNGDFARIVTLNAEIAYRAFGDPQMREMVNRADRVTPDGSGIVWAAGRYGRQNLERVSGIDLMQELLKEATQRGWKVFFFGGQEEIVLAAAQNAKACYDGLNVVGYRNGYFAEEEIPSILAEIKASGADLIFVGLGAPKQDFWLEQYGEETGAKVGIGVGGSFDVLSGKVRRAPRFFQAIGAEWLWRLVREPWRFKRMLALPRFMRLVMKETR